MSLTICLGKQSLISSWHYKQTLGILDNKDIRLIVSTDHISYSDIFDYENLIYSNRIEEYRRHEKKFQRIINETDFDSVCKNNNLQEYLRRQFEEFDFTPLILIISDQRKIKITSSLLKYLNDEVKQIPIKLVTEKHTSNCDLFFDSFCLHENLNLLDGRKSVYFEIEKIPGDILGNSCFSSTIIYESQMVYLKNHISIPEYFDILNRPGFLPYHNFYFTDMMRFPIPEEPVDNLNYTLINTAGDSNLDYYKREDKLNPCQIVIGDKDSYNFLYNKKKPWLLKRSFLTDSGYNYPSLMKLNGFHENLKIYNLIKNLEKSIDSQQHEILETLYRIQN